MSAFGQVKLFTQRVSNDGLDLQSGYTKGPLVKTNSNTVGVNRTFDPIGYVRPGVARWEDRSDGIQVGYPVMELSVRRPGNGSKVSRVTFTLSLPTLEQTSASTASGIQPAPTRAYDHRVKVEFLCPERGAQWERKALMQALITALATTVNALDDAPSDTTASPVYDAVVNFEQPY